VNAIDQIILQEMSSGFDAVVALPTLAFLDLPSPTVVVGFDFVPKHHSQLTVLHRPRYKDFALFF
jgi:hypothetical protein